MVRYIPNRLYEKGSRRERELVNLARKDGHYATRSAGSKSQIDVIRVIGDTIEFIQVKGCNQKIEMPAFPEVLKVKRILAYKKLGKWVFKELNK